MTRTLISAIVAIAATAVVYAGQQAPSQAPVPESIWQTANKNVLVLVPVSGAWTADYEKDGAKVVQVLTIAGTAASSAPNADAPGAFPLAVARDVKTFPAGTLEVSFKLVSGATDQTAGIVFGLQPDGSYTYARYNTKDGNLAVWKFENGQRTVLQQGDVREQLPLGQWHTLQVTIAGAVVSASVKGSTLAARYTLPAPVQGRVGVWTNTDSVTSFKDFVVVGHHLVHR